MKKKIIVAIISITVLILAGCGNKAVEVMGEIEDMQEVADASTPEPTVDPGENVSDETANEDVAEDVVYSGFTFYDPNLKVRYDVERETFVDDTGNPIDDINAFMVAMGNVPEDHENGLVYEPGLGFIDMDTFMQVDPKTGLLIDPETGSLIDKKSIVTNSTPGYFAYEDGSSNSGGGSSSGGSSSTGNTTSNQSSGSNSSGSSAGTSSTGNGTSNSTGGATSGQSAGSGGSGNTSEAGSSNSGSSTPATPAPNVENTTPSTPATPAPSAPAAPEQPAQPAPHSHSYAWAESGDSRILTCSCGVTTGITEYRYGSVWGYYDDGAAGTLFSLVNEQRNASQYTVQEQGFTVAIENVPSLNSNSDLTTKARNRAVEAATNFSHGSNADECLAWGQGNANAAFEAWCYSESHARAMVNTDYVSGGTACFWFDSDNSGTNLTPIWVLELGR